MRNTENGNAHIQALLAYYIPVHPAVSLRVSFFYIIIIIITLIIMYELAYMYVTILSCRATKETEFCHLNNSIHNSMIIIIVFIYWRILFYKYNFLP